MRPTGTPIGILHTGDPDAVDVSDAIHMPENSCAEARAGKALYALATRVVFLFEIMGTCGYSGFYGNSSKIQHVIDVEERAAEYPIFKSKSEMLRLLARQVRACVYWTWRADHCNFDNLPSIFD